MINDCGLNRTSALTILLLVLMQGMLVGWGARANGLAADVSDRLIAITTAFVGGDVVVFGSTETEGPVIITMHGPRQNQMVRRKSRMAGVWINRDRVEFDNVPSYYAIASSHPLEEVADLAVLDRLQLGVEHLKLDVVDPSGYSQDEIMEFAKALIRNKEREGLYTVTPEAINFPGSKLFRATFRFPASVPPGLYRIEVFHLEDGAVIGAHQSSLQISKVGMEAEVFDFAREHAAFYGLAAILIAVMSGWLAGVIFRRA